MMEINIFASRYDTSSLRPAFILPPPPPPPNKNNKKTKKRKKDRRREYVGKRGGEGEKGVTPNKILNLPKHLEMQLY